jgi:hypothetical protein
MSGLAVADALKARLAAQRAVPRAA